MSVILHDDFTDDFRLLETMGFLASSFDLVVDDLRPLAFGHAHVAEEGNETTFVHALLPGRIRACAVLRWAPMGDGSKLLIEARSGEMH